MPIRSSHRQTFTRATAALALLAIGAGLSGCAEMGESMSSAFADPAKYDLYECKQLGPERKSLTSRAAELQGLMAKAETGVAGPVVAELAYRNEYISVRAQSKLAEEAWRRNKCQEEARHAARRRPRHRRQPKAHARRRGPAARCTRRRFRMRSRDDYARQS